MGSGISGLYNGTSERSQPYQEYYKVVKEMIEFDKERGIYSDDIGYYKNPTAQDLKDVIVDNKIVFQQNDGKWGPYTGSLTYVIDKDGKIIIGKRNGNGFSGKATPHPTLIGGKNPKVKMAGIIIVNNGKIVSYNNKSGHYKPNIKSIKVADEEFKKLPTELFVKGGN